MTNISVLIADDEVEVADILEAYFAREGFRTHRVADGQAVIDVYSVLNPDLVLLDVKMSKSDGWEVLTQLRRNSDVPVIIVTAMGEDIDRLQGLRLGADDYIIKPFNPVEVVARAKAVLRRANKPFRKSLIRLGLLEVHLDNFIAKVKDAPEPLNLTLTEFRILACLAKSANHVVTRSELINACLPGSDALERTVDSHVSNLRRKLETSGALGMLSAVRGVGYRLVRGA